MEFGGLLRLSGGTSTQVQLVLTDSSVRLKAGSSDLGEWFLESCSCRRKSLSEFELDFDGELARFLPDDPDGFGAMVAQRFTHIRLADRVDAVRRGPEAFPDSDSDSVGRRGLRGIGFGVLAAIVGGSVIVLSVLIGGGNEIVSVPTIALVTVTDVDTAAGVFDLTPTEFAERWNVTSGRLNAGLLIRGRLGPGNFETALSPMLSLQGTVDEKGAMSRVVIAGDPSDDTVSDEAIIAAWGIAISVAAPDLDASGRRDLLEQLGFDLSRRDLADLDGEVEDGNIRYTLTYIQEFSSVLFTLAQM